MKFSRKWLNEYVDILDIDLNELVDKLTLNSFEVESVEYEGEKLNNIVVALIEKIEKHPNADTLQVCQANIGNKVLQIITRATNVFEGAYVPLALDGAVLPNGLEIKPTKMRGIDSMGMFCGAEEIGLPNDGVDGIYILKGQFTPGENIAKVLGKDDYILDVTILSNRPDCNSIYFFAKEVGAIFNRKVKALNLDYVCDKNVDKNISVEVKTDNCLSYSAVIVDDVKIEQSPQWMQDRLATVGIRPINAIVDITNYVLTEIGQPMHAFDFDKITKSKIVVRQANNGDKFLALNEQEYNLDDSIMVIADGEKAMALGGVMGGLDSGVSEQTKTIVFESASFARGNIRSTVRKLGLSSDSSLRFERGVVPFLCEIGLKRALHLIQKLNIGQISCNVQKVQNYKERSNVLQCSASKINAQLGLNLSMKQMSELLNRLQFDIKAIDDDKFECIYPKYRNDLFGEQDIAEEIIRMYGFDKVAVKLMENVHFNVQVPNNLYNSREKISNLLTNLGLYEMICLNLENKNIQTQLLCDQSNLVVIKNPLSADYEVLRKTCVSSILNTVKYNNAHSNKNLKLYEVGKEYELISGNYVEKDVVSMCLTGKKPNFFEVKNWCESIAYAFNVKFDYEVCDDKPYLNSYKSAYILLDGKKVGYIGEIHPRVVKNFDLLENVIVAVLYFADLPIIESVHEVKQFSKYQPVIRDLTFLVPDDMNYKTLYDEIVLSSGKNCVSVNLIDIYKGENVANGYKSMTFELVYEKQEGTFTDEEMQNNVNKLLNALKYKKNIRLKDEV